MSESKFWEARLRDDIRWGKIRFYMPEHSPYSTMIDAASAVKEIDRLRATIKNLKSGTWRLEDV